MTNALLTAPQVAPVAAGQQVAPPRFAAIRRRMILDFCKWDPQVGDVTTLADFPILIDRQTWHQLQRWAEELTAEMFQAEQSLLQRPDLQKWIGVPGPIIRALRQNPARTTARTARFDFHLTTDGWRISEANSDVPGGFTEASHFTRLMQMEFPEFQIPGDPLKLWADAIAHQAAGAPAALLSAPGFMEDHQIMTCIAHQLTIRGCEAFLATPPNLQWNAGVPRLAGRQLGAIVRFFQAEWLVGARGYRELLSTAGVPVSNPGIAAISESKRFALAWDKLKLPMARWRALLPETRDPRDAPLGDGFWILKTAYCNTGDTVTIPGESTEKDWRAAVRSSRWWPCHWVAQRKFKTIMIETPRGPMAPCIGVYTVNGNAAGAYVRLAPSQVIGYSAIDAALLVKG